MTIPRVEFLVMKTRSLEERRGEERRGETADKRKCGRIIPSNCSVHT
jgi:hypothetical protein